MNYYQVNCGDVDAKYFMSNIESDEVEYFIGEIFDECINVETIEPEEIEDDEENITEIVRFGDDTLGVKAYSCAEANYWEELGVSTSFNS